MAMSDGGPAYPVHEDVYIYTNGEPAMGISMRDYLAAAANEEDVQAWIPQKTADCEALCDKFGLPRKVAALRCWARYKHADCMMAIAKGDFYG